MSRDEQPKKRRRRNRWGDAPAATNSSSTDGAPAPPSQDDAKAKALALQESIRQRLAALKQATNKRPLDDTVAAPTAKRAKHFELDMSVTGPTFQQQQAVAKPKQNPYLSHLEVEQQVQDERLVQRTSKPRPRHKALHFVEPGTFVEIAERKRQKAANAMESGFSSGRKVGMYVQASEMAHVVYGGGGGGVEKETAAERADANPDVRVPIMEWWDTELLPSKVKKTVASTEGKALTLQTKAQLQQLSTKDAPQPQQQEEEHDDLRNVCFQDASISYSKTATLVQHIVPISTSKKPPPQPVLYLTKKERKRQRKLRRAEKQRQLQDLQAAGLVPAPEPRLTLQNFIRVMGDQALLDPSQMEQKVQEQMQARQQAHYERNEAKKLSKEERSEKRARKLLEDTSESVSVALFWVKDMSHPYHRAKVELNARQNNITGGVLECDSAQLACVICEGGPKAIKRFTRLMLVRMKWQGTEEAIEEDDEDKEGEEGVVTHKFNPDNKCELVWTGMATRRLFKGFVFQSCETSDVARRVLKAKGVGHFWDQVLTHAQGESFHLKLAASEDEDEKMDGS